MSRLSPLSAALEAVITQPPKVGSSLKKPMTGMVVSESEIYALMETIDMDGNGDVDRDEFGASSRLVFSTSTAIARPMYCCTLY